MPPDEVLAEVRGWVTKAESDLRNIDLVLPNRDAPLDTVCFHAQQAAEKYLKGLLTYHGAAFRKTHDLPELVAMLPVFSSAKTAVGDLSELADVAVAARYPGDPDDYDRPTADRLVGQAQLVKSSVLAELAGNGFML